MQPKLGILAGNGVLPRLLIDAARQQGRDLFVVAFNDQADPKTVESTDHVWLRLGAAGDAIDALRRAGCRDIVMGGGVRRPSLYELRPDWWAAKFFAKAGFAMLGDDGLLQAIRRELEGEGFNMLAPQDLLNELLAPAALLTPRFEPDELAQADINRGIAVLRALAPIDVGQAVVVQQGLVLGIEAIEGTEALIARSSKLRREGEGGVLVKISKPQQDRRLDLPSIGPDTVRQCLEAGLRGIAIEAGRSLILSRGETVAIAEASGLFITGLELAS